MAAHRWMVAPGARPESRSRERGAKDILALLGPDRIRPPGTGRRSVLHLDPELPRTLEGLVESSAGGGPESSLRSTQKDTRTLAPQLTAQRCPTSHEEVDQLQREMSHSLQGGCKTTQGNDQPRWRRFEGRRLYSRARQLVVTADDGGSNGYRLCQQRMELRGSPAGRNWRLPCTTLRHEQGNGRKAIIACCRSSPRTLSENPFATMRPARALRQAEGLRNASRRGCASICGRNPVG